jgi:hypothetical protein
MTDDLVKRLREAARQYVDNEYNLHARAADRTEQLEAALREISRLTDYDGTANLIGHMARAALGEKKDG